jgi:hypothetical protein
MTWLTKLREAAQKATKGPWTKDGRDVRAYYTHFDHRMAAASTEENAAHIARWDPSTILKVLDVIEQAKLIGCIRYHDSGRDCMKCAGCVLDEKIAALHQHVEATT